MSTHLHLANARARGKRPWYFQHPESERVFNVALALAQELAVTRERLDTVERILQAKGTIAAGEIDAFVPTKAVAEARSAAQQQYLATILRVVHQELDAEADLRPAASIEELGG